MNILLIKKYNINNKKIHLNQLLVIITNNKKVKIIIRFINTCFITTLKIEIT